MIASGPHVRVRACGPAAAVLRHVLEALPPKLTEGEPMTYEWDVDKFIADQARRRGASLTLIALLLILAVRLIG